MKGVEERGHGVGAGAGGGGHVGDGDKDGRGDGQARLLGALPHRTRRPLLPHLQVPCRPLIRVIAQSFPSHLGQIRVMFDGGDRYFPLIRVISESYPSHIRVMSESFLRVLPAGRPAPRTASGTRIRLEKDRKDPERNGTRAGTRIRAAHGPRGRTSRQLVPARPVGPFPPPHQHLPRPALLPPPRPPPSLGCGERVEACIRMHAWIGRWWMDRPDGQAGRQRACWVQATETEACIGIREELTIRLG